MNMVRVRVRVSSFGVKLVIELMIKKSSTGEYGHFLELHIQ